MWTRYLTGVSIGAIVTGLLFLLMDRLVATGISPFSEPPPPVLIELARVDEDRDVVVERDRPKPPEPPDEPPPDLPRQSIVDGHEGAGLAITGPGPVAVTVGPEHGWASDGEILPVVRVEPVYPRRAQARGIEGYVVLEFSVTAAGEVSDPVVVDAQPPGVFERSAQQAVVKFKYRPRIVGGRPVAVHGVRNRITFALDGD